MPRIRARILVVAAATTAAVIGITGCSPEYWPAEETEETFEPGSTPAPSTLEDTLPKPSLTVPQFERVLDSVRDTFEQADADLDADLLSSRAGGAVLEARSVSYRAQEADGDVEPIGGLPDGDVELILPEQNESWPRHLLAVVSWQDETKVPEALVFRQATARSKFVLTYQMYLQAGVQLPEVAASQVGAPVVSTESTLTQLPPAEIPGAYADIMSSGGDAEHAASFASEPDELRASLGYERKQELYVDNEAFELIDFTFVNGEGDSPVIALSTNDGGALVAASFTERIEFQPTEDGVSVTLSESRSGLRALLGGEERIESGIARTDEYQVFFYVPPAAREGDEPQQIRVLGYNAALVEAEELN